LFLLDFYFIFTEGAVILVHVACDGIIEWYPRADLLQVFARVVNDRRCSPLLKSHHFIWAHGAQQVVVDQEPNRLRAIVVLRAHAHVGNEVPTFHERGFRV
jgi:hypothetical protein